MEKYERISPGAFDRIFNMAAERQQFDHEEKMSTIAASQNRVDKTYRNAMVAMPMAFMLCFSLIVAGVYLIITGHSLAGTLFGTPAFIAVLRYFLGPVKLSKNKDRPPVNNQDNNK
ncbi:hypothetical protein SAMN04487865_101439 [Succinivibrio dextrinosolvens]|uniref:Uncharacterized protein n=2 Tax=Succinivibrio dextrinosolvens TaxID=83771 RepID=A0A662Z8G1_9GAMM|nr:hypothetical protein SAMN04487865_101439 [Succinivibrio dextrinosolvens]